VAHHAAGLSRLTKNAALVEALKTDYRQAALSPADRAMLDYAHKLTLTPWAMQAEDVETLRAHDFTDRAVLDINQVTAYYAYVNRLADGLGVPLEAIWRDP
jgi:uncharacterized peroxidase-related enzyme